MCSLFSERQGVIKLLILNPNDVPIELRNRIWNIIKDYIDKEFHND